MASEPGVAASRPGSSLIQLGAPTLVPIRLALGGVPVWQAPLAVALVLLLIPG
jgi:ABC-2 type transport system permease protein